MKFKKTLTVEERLSKLEKDSHKPVDFTALVTELTLRIELLEKKVNEPSRHTVKPKTFRDANGKERCDECQCSLALCNCINGYGT